MKTSGINYSIKSVETEIVAKSDGRSIEGYASTYGNVDRQGEIVVPGAFTETIAERYPKNLIKLFFDHWEPVGKMSDLPRDDSTGLYIFGQVGTTAACKNAYQLAADGIANHLSIGYTTVESSDAVVGGETVTELKKLSLWEVSIVVFPANDLATISAVKSASHGLEAVAEYAAMRLSMARGILSRDSGFIPDVDLARLADIKSEISTIAASMSLKLAARQLTTK